MNNLDKNYQLLLKDILENGTTKKDRTGTGTLSVFGRQIRHKMSEGFPLLTTKKMRWKSIVTELLWFLRGDTNIKYLVNNGCNIWNGDAYKKYKNTNPDYLANDEMFKTEKGTYKFFTQEEFVNKIKTDDEFAKKWGELGPIYGKQWRNWKGKLIDKSEEFNAHTAWVPEQIDQIQNLINDLKTNPDSRRLMVNAWNVGELDQMVLPPCHFSFQVYTRELSLDERYKLANINGGKENLLDKPNYTEEQQHSMLDELVPKRAISLMWNQRSVDTFLGLPFNIASYGLLLEIIAKEVNMVPDELIGNLGDTHLYSNHIQQAKTQIDRTSFELPEVRLRNYNTLEELLNTNNSMNMIQLWRYDSHPAIKAPLSN
jgi:thymidylate synthase